jgi:protein-ribulosamine 3-kinase
MSISESETLLTRAVAQALGVAVTGARPVSGGDINEAFILDLADGKTVFVKTNSDAPRAMFWTEARGLHWLSEAAALRVPGVLAVGQNLEAPAYLVLEHIRSAPRRRDFDEALGRGLAALHRFGVPGFGLDHDNFIGRLRQRNVPQRKWAEFYRNHRLEPQLVRAVERGLTSPVVRQGFERLFARLDGLVGPPEPPARLHGDLWSGNLLVDETGGPCLVDPAVYGGHREIDLAMMRLFGGFSDRVFDAYEERWPLADGWEERVPLYQLYPMLVHVNLFGGSYITSVERLLDRLL